MIEDIYVIHHSHTDIGYTHDQPTLWDIERRFIDAAIAAAADTRDVDEPHAFKWTVETTAPLLHWLETASSEQVEQFQELEDAGRIEVTAMLANITPLYDATETIESLRPVRHLREEYGFDIRYAMNCDVNGQNWPLVDALLDSGIEGFSMAINNHFGGAPLDRPEVFHWEGPSGRTLPAVNGYHYSTGHRLGLGRDAAVLRDIWPKIEAHLEEIDYPLSALMIECLHPFGDNGSAYEALGPFVESWNDQEAVIDGDVPRLRMATPSEWWAVVDEHADELSTYRGDWTDYWNFGAASSARETAINRESRRRLYAADALEAIHSALGNGSTDRPPHRRAATGTRDEAWWAVQFYDEHTWGADSSVYAPRGEDAASQWNHKANYAYTGRSLSNLLQRDGLAELGREIDTEEVGQ